MEVHQGDVRLILGENFIHLEKGIVKVGVHLTPADQVHHTDAQAPRTVKDSPAPAKGPAGIVGRADQVAAVVHIGRDLLFIPGVIAHCDYICSGGEDFLCLTGEQAVAGGIFSVDYGEVYLMELAKRRQMAMKELHTTVAHHVSHGQNTQLHCGASFI